jgi:hypothetical protein
MCSLDAGEAGDPDGGARDAEARDAEALDLVERFDVGGPDAETSDARALDAEAADADAAGDAGDIGPRADAAIDAGQDAGPPDARPIDLTEANASNWGVGQHGQFAWSDAATPRCMAAPLRSNVVGYSTMGISIQNDVTTVAVNTTSLRVSTNMVGYTFFWFYPSTIDAAMDVSSATEIRFFVDAANPGMVGWQGTFPALYLCSRTGAYRELYPTMNLLPTAQSTLMPMIVPLSGGVSGGVTWVRRDSVMSTLDLRSVDWIEFAADTWDFPPTTIWIDGLHFQ